MTTAAARFLFSLGQALATLGLYSDTHPARQRVMQGAFDHLRRLQEEDPRPSFSLLGREVVYRGQVLREMESWDWTERLSEAGVQRLEIASDVTLQDYEAFVEEVRVLVGGAPRNTVNARPARQTGIRFGPLSVRDGATDAHAGLSLRTATIAYSLAEEADAVRWLHREVEERGRLALLEAETVVSSLSVAMHADSQIIIPLLRLKTFDQYTTTHSMNVAVLSMALAEALGFGARDVRTFGTAGLLHDLGKVRVPREILTKPGKLTEQERAVLNQHPADGARIILSSDEQLALAAAVAYEHHIMIDGGGYPCVHYPRECHFASRLVHVCDVFDALHTDRPYRAAWDAERALRYIEERAGSEFDAEIARTFAAMMRRYAERVTVVQDEGALPSAEGVPSAAPAKE
jgi:putative nucleotidyltransferase with HDIG domain